MIDSTIGAGVLLALWLLFLFVELALVVWALILLFTSRKSREMKALWFLIILVLPLLGSIVYLIWGGKR